MKKLKIFGLFLALFAGVGLVACSNDDNNEEDFVIHDFLPVISSFEIVDADGNSLIAPEGPLYGADFSVTFNEKDYPADWETITRSRLYLPSFKGLYYSPEINGGGPWLEFGEFNGQNSEGTFTFNLPDGTKHEVTFNRYIKVNGKNTAVTQTVTFDGKVVSEFTNADSPVYDFKIVCDL